MSDNALSAWRRTPWELKPNTSLYGPARATFAR